MKRIELKGRIQEILETGVQEIINMAEKKRSTDLIAAIKILEKAEQIIPKFHNKEKFSTQNVPQGQQEILYLTKYARILYEIGKYKAALGCYSELAKNQSGNILFKKAVGDCLRKLKEYDNALERYQEALEDCDDPVDKSAILNSRGLTYMAIRNMELAQKDFDQAISLTLKSPNPLYFCNKASDLYILDKKQESIEYFKKAYDLIKEGKSIGLTKQNIESIQRKLAPFIGWLEDLNKIKLSNKDEIINAREIILVENEVSDLTDPISEGASKVKQLLDTKQNLAIIQKNSRLNEYYDGFVFSLAQAYSTAIVVNSGLLVINTGNLGVEIISKLISYIPLIGDKVSDVISGGWNAIKAAKVQKAAASICKFSTTCNDFNEIAQDSIVKVILLRQDQINAIVPEPILSRWETKFLAIIKKLHDLNVNLYGERNETPMQKLGYKVATDLMEKFISSGKIYSGKPAINISTEEKKQKLFELALKLLDEKDMVNQPDVSPNEINVFIGNNLGIPNISEPKTCCQKAFEKCEIFSVYNIKYDNPLLNDQKKLLELAQKFGLEKVINLSHQLTESKDGKFDLAILEPILLGQYFSEGD